MSEAKRENNIFATVLTYAAPSANYRGENENNRSVIQRITRGEQEFPVLSSEAIRNGCRETLIKKGHSLNRSRVRDADQPTVSYKEPPDSDKYIDDFLFGYMSTAKEIKAPKRDSIWRVNMAVALSPFRFDATFHQSPHTLFQNAEDKPFENATSSALLHHEVSYTAYQYPFALALNDCVEYPERAATLLDAIWELTNVAGGHARSYYEMAPRSLVIRITPKLVAGYNTYGFDEEGNFPELARINEKDLPGSEFLVGGEIVRKMSETQRKELSNVKVFLSESPQKILEEILRRERLDKAGLKVRREEKAAK